ncbi:MAG: class I SAM-dependent methyltransferase [Desulfurella sp.]|uniref:class I SAM-dependent methyltransferase n=1 Tax=Desulfurella sp. TaxID=1962857 RepID=UPI003D0972CE
MQHLTDKGFWEKYWLSKKNLTVPLPRKYLFSELFEKIVHDKPIKTALEIGGFPGFYSVYLKKFFNIDTFLVDLVIFEEITDKLLEANNLPMNSIKVYEADIFTWKTEKKFDLVYSNGFIEHFGDTLSVIQLHKEFLNPGGVVFITLPNFKNINGLFQKVFDIENYKKHNISCMNPNFLKEKTEQAGFINVRVFYYGYFSIWLENEARKKWLARCLRSILYYPLKSICKLFRFNHKFLSPYLIIIAENPA